MAIPHPAVKLARNLDYILGRHPEEFGLVLDAEGFVKVKDLLKALAEDRAYRYVRRGHLDEILMVVADAPIEIREGRIRAVRREALAPRTAAEALPKLLYTCVRRKAYPVVLRDGVLPTAGPHVVLCADQEMALRIGRRSDADPVMLTVSVARALTLCGGFLSAGPGLYLAPEIPAGCFSGPPLARERVEATGNSAPPPRPAPVSPGSFFLDPEKTRALQSDLGDGKKERARIGSGTGKRPSG